jgi:hypothetical protein
MPTHTLAAGEIAAHAMRLTPNTVETVIFPDALVSVEIVADGAAAVYYTVNGAAPAVGGANTYLLPAGAVAVDVRNTVGNVDALTTVKMISSGAPLVSVQQGVTG